MLRYGVCIYMPKAWNSVSLNFINFIGHLVQAWGMVCVSYL